MGKRQGGAGVVLEPSLQGARTLRAWEGVLTLGPAVGAGATYRKFRLEGLLAACGPGRGLGTPQTHAAPREHLSCRVQGPAHPHRITRFARNSILDLPFQKRKAPDSA